MTASAVHLAMACPFGDDCPGPVACYGVDLCRPPTWKRTADPAEVTCARCLSSPVYQEVPS